MAHIDWCTEIGITQSLIQHNKLVIETRKKLRESRIYPVVDTILEYAFHRKTVNIIRFSSNIFNKQVIWADPKCNLIIKIGILIPSIHDYDQTDTGIWIKIKHNFHSRAIRCDINSILIAILDDDYTMLSQEFDSVLTHAGNLVESACSISRCKEGMMLGMKKVAAEWLNGC